MPTMESVVRVDGSRRRFGSGFVAYCDDKAGLVMTNEHVVTDKSTVKVWFPGGQQRLDARVVRRSKTHDLALARFKTEGCNLVPALDFASPDPIPESGDVTLHAYYITPEGIELYPAETEGSICGDPQNKNGRVTLIADYTSQGGTSGGPVLMGNKVIGVNLSGLGAIQDFITLQSVVAALEEWDPRELGGDVIKQKLQKIAKECAVRDMGSNEAD